LLFLTASRLAGGPEAFGRKLREQLEGDNTDRALSAGRLLLQLVVSQ
jgi:hypothetical protein